MPAHLDEPPPGTTVDPLCFLMRGWVSLGAGQSQIVSIEARVGEVVIGSTRALYLRPDVVAAFSLPAGTLTGFELFAHHPAFVPGQPFAVEVSAVLRDGRRVPAIAPQKVTAIDRDFRQNHFGVMLDQSTIAIQGRPQIFVTGPSGAVGSAELVDLITRHLGPPPRRVLDVGCGLGYYGRELLARGYDWFGVEVKPADCAELARMGLPFQQIEAGSPLPFADAAYDAALCVEVLEHIAEPRAFLREVKRVAPHRLLVSVPNCELLGYLPDYLATPWHMLEGDHKNFFTRWSLGSLLREFYSHVEVRFHSPYPLRSSKDTPLHYQLLAIATSGPE